MRYVLGIDGGQSTTTAYLADEHGRLLATGVGGPANHIHEPGGINRIRKSLSDAIGEARAAANLTDAEIAYAYLGMTGGSQEMEEVVRPVVPAQQMALGHDSLIALYAVTYGAPGVVVIGGTGSVGFGRDATGRTARAGGWGYIFGDEGSGYWIATQALRSAVRALDGTGPDTRLLQGMLDSLGAGSITEVHRRIYSGELARVEIAMLSSDVAALAEAGDHVASAILAEAGRELGLLAEAVIEKLTWGERPIEVGAFGGVFHSKRVCSAFAKTVSQACADAIVVQPRVPAAVAAVLLALEAIGAPASPETLRSMSDQARIFGRFML